MIWISWRWNSNQIIILNDTYVQNIITDYTYVAKAVQNTVQRFAWVYSSVVTD